MSIQGKVFLVTGGGRGLGREIAAALGGAGAAVFVNDVNPDSAAETARLVETAGGRAHVHIADISKKFPVQAMFNEIEDVFGRLDGVVNNARVEPHKPLMDMDEWDWRRTLDVNLTGAFLLFQVAGRILRDRGGGDILQLVQEPEPAAGLAAYAATRFGLDGLGAVAWSELGEAGIRYRVVTYTAGDYRSAVEEVVLLLDDQTGD